MDAYGCRTSDSVYFTRDARKLVATIFRRIHKKKTLTLPPHPGGKRLLHPEVRAWTFALKEDVARASASDQIEGPCATFDAIQLALAIQSASKKGGRGRRGAATKRAALPLLVIRPASRRMK